MKEFFVGLLVIVTFLVLSLVAVLLFPVFVVLGFFLRHVIALFLIILSIWLVGKVALLGMERLKSKKNKSWQA